MLVINAQYCEFVMGYRLDVGRAKRLGLHRVPKSESKV